MILFSLLRPGSSDSKLEAFVKINRKDFCSSSSHHYA